MQYANASGDKTDSIDPDAIGNNFECFLPEVGNIRLACRNLGIAADG